MTVYLFNTSLSLYTAVIVGGIDMMSQALMLAKKPHIIIGKLKGSVQIKPKESYD